MITIFAVVFLAVAAGNVGYLLRDRELRFAGGLADAVCGPLTAYDKWSLGASAALFFVAIVLLALR